MGKKLIIKGADFSENAILTDKWYNSYEVLQGHSTYSASVFCINPNEIVGLGLVGKPINAFRLYSLIDIADGIHISHVKLNGSYGSGTVDYETIKDYGYFPVTSGINELKLPESVVLSEGETILFSNSKNALTISSKTEDNNIFSGFNGQDWSPNYYIKIMLGYKVGE